ncbi:hypothetical protein GCM10010530_15820 [Kribbella aluminosa]
MPVSAAAKQTTIGGYARSTATASAGTVRNIRKANNNDSSPRPPPLCRSPGTRSEIGSQRVAKARTPRPSQSPASGERRAQALLPMPIVMAWRSA